MTNDLQVNVITQRINEITTPIAVAVFHYGARKVTMYTKPGKFTAYLGKFIRDAQSTSNVKSSEVNFLERYMTTTIDVTPYMYNCLINRMGSRSLIFSSEDQRGLMDFLHFTLKDCE